MTDKQKRFADEYLIDCNIARAYMAAYPKVKSVVSASTAGGRLLKNVEVKAYIDEQMQKIQSSKIAKAEEVLESLTAILRGETEDQVVVTEGQGEGYSQARIIEKRVSEKDRLKAAELLAKYHQLLVPKVQIEAEKGGGVIVLAEATDGEP